MQFDAANFERLVRQLVEVKPLVLQLHFRDGMASGAVVAGPCGRLMTAPPEGAAERPFGLREAAEDEPYEQPADLGHGERDQRPGGRPAAPFFDAGLRRPRTADARMAASIAWANIERVTCRCQPAQPRTS